PPVRALFPYTTLFRSRSGHQVVESAVALSGEREVQLRIPDWIFQLPKQQISLFLRAWWSAVGSVGEHGLALAPPSVAVADGLSRLLLRFGISAIITEDAEALSITGSDDVRRFLQEIGIDGRHSASAEALLRRVRSETEADPPVLQDFRFGIRWGPLSL